MDDKIYILAIIAWVAYSFYSSYNKAKKKKEALPAAPPVKPDLPNISPWVSPEEKTIIQAKKPRTSFEFPDPYNSFNNSLVDDSIEEMSSIENLSSETLHEASEKFSKKITYSPSNHTALHMFDTDFGIDEIRKAVIYAEIINRKY